MRKGGQEQHWNPGKRRREEKKRLSLLYVLWKFSYQSFFFFRCAKFSGDSMSSRYTEGSDQSEETLKD